MSGSNNLGNFLQDRRAVAVLAGLFFLVVFRSMGAGKDGPTASGGPEIFGVMVDAGSTVRFKGGSNGAGGGSCFLFPLAHIRGACDVCMR